MSPVPAHSLLLAGAPAAAAAWTLTNLPNLQLLLDASNAASITSSGGRVSAWADLTANANSQSQATSGQKPLTASHTINGLNAIYFSDGRGDNMGGSSLAVAPPFTVIFIGKHVSATAWLACNTSNAGANSNFTFGVSGANWQASQTNSITGGTADTTTPHCFVAAANGASSQFWVDGTSIGTGTFSGNLSALIMGDQPGRVNSDVGVFAVMSSAIGGSDLSSLVSYSQSTWGTP